PETDDGPIIIQAAVPVYADDNEATLAARVLAEEHRILPLALSWIAQGRTRVRGRLVKIDGTLPPPQSLRNPAAEG
ncbi:MAG: formyltransferase family protein, partial [Pseudomonadota bacterium]